MIPRYHGRWKIETPVIAAEGSSPHTGWRFDVTIRWNGDRQHYVVMSSLDGSAKPVGRNRIRRWLREHKAEPVDGQQPVA